MPFPFAAALGRMLGGGGAAAGGGAAEATAARGGMARAAALKAEQKAVDDSAGKTKSFTDRLREFRTAAFQASATTYFLKGMVEGAFGKIAGSATMAANVIQSMAAPFANLTRLANPAVVKLFEMAWEDALAVVGRAAIPLIDSFRRAMENVGDTYAKMEPFLTKFFERVGGAIEMVFSAMADAAEQNAPMIDLMLTALGRVAQAFGYVASTALKLFNALYLPFRIINALAGGAGFGDINRKATSKGAAIRDVQITGSAEEFAREAQRKAFMSAAAQARGGPEPKNPLDELPAISSGITTIARLVRDILDYIKFIRTGQMPDIETPEERAAREARVQKLVGEGVEQEFVKAGAAATGFGPDVGQAIIDIAYRMRAFQMGG